MHNERVGQHCALYIDQLRRDLYPQPFVVPSAATVGEIVPKNFSQ